MLYILESNLFKWTGLWTWKLCYKYADHEPWNSMFMSCFLVFTYDWFSTICFFSSIKQARYKFFSRSRHFALFRIWAGLKLESETTPFFAAQLYTDFRTRRAAVLCVWKLRAGPWFADKLCAYRYVWRPRFTQSSAGKVLWNLTPTRWKFFQRSSSEWLCNCNFCSLQVLNFDLIIVNAKWIFLNGYR